ncbi:MAG: MmcQ/YjbR family DNA-binding protein [Devosia sp.]|nr:MmcQ/YjbR family DNA-binding protein [Devosia sp.]
MGRTAGRVPDLFEREAFEAFVLRLPATALVHQWGDTAVGKVGGKIFALHGGGVAGDPAALSFKCSDLAFEMLPELLGVRPAPYLARAKWVAVAEGSALSRAELVAYVTEAHRLVAARLPRRLRAELGLTADHPGTTS